jgi:hypothetical protein
MIPPGLEGRFPVTLADIPQFPAIEAALPQLEKGGRWRPPECTARHKVREAVLLRIRDVYPRIRIFPIPDPNFFYPGYEFFHPGSRVGIKEFEYFSPKKWFLSSRKYDPGCSSRIRILIFGPSRIQGS